MTKEKAYYQALLILKHLPKEEYDLIPREIIDDIENKMEYDENITIDSSVELEKQKIDEKTYNILDKVIKAVEKNKKVDISSNNRLVLQENKINREQLEMNDYIRKCKTENELHEAGIEIIRLNQIIEMLRKENTKIGEAKELIIGYKNVTMSKEEEIKNLNEEVKKIKKNNEELYELLNKIPKFIRKIFLKDDIKLLEE